MSDARTLGDLPSLFTPSEVAAKLACSERTLREVARKHGCCRQLGKKLFFTAEDIEALLEAVKVKPKVSNANSPDGTDAATSLMLARLALQKRKRTTSRGK